MRLTDIVQHGAIVASLASNERDAVISEMIDAVVAADKALSKVRDELLTRVLDREKRGTTGFGKGIAVPHVKHRAIKQMRAAIGLSGGGIDFNSLDKQPVYSVFLLLSPEDRPEEHLQAMEVIFKSLSEETFRRFLRQARSAEEVRSLLEEADSQRLAG
ncbi:MAG: PTS sugar transporter subunit IIA [Phycisphaeraceae bacterium]|nr:PTS sugar transporter subunit IIA [Phycisphaeraceae bacterium]